jgi:hypothetical protein
MLRGVSGLFVRRMGRTGGITGLVLVFPLDLEDVKEVGTGGLDLDQVFIWLGYGVGEVGDPELIRSLLWC